MMEPTRVRCDGLNTENQPYEAERDMTGTGLKICRLGGLPMLLLIAGPALAQTKDHAPVALPSARLMEQDKAGTESWTYAQPASVFTKYRTVIVDPTTVYQGPDAQFDGVDPADRYKYASVITDELRQEIAKTFPAPARPQGDTLRLRVTIL